MVQHNISILCLQETWARKAEYFADDVFKVVLSGKDASGRTWSGVGFAVAPWCSRSIARFLQYSDRLASLKMKINGGKIGIITAYAPHNLRPYDERVEFYTGVGILYDKC